MTENLIRSSSSLLLNQLKSTEVERIGQPVLDLFLAQLAIQLNKTVGSVETSDEQCEAFNSLTDSLTLSILNNTLTEQEKIRSVISQRYLQIKLVTIVQEWFLSKCVSGEQSDPGLSLWSVQN